MHQSSDFYKRAKFIKSALKFKDCPADFGREVAFAGRSNVGKSSALNTLTQNKSLMRTSKTPGRTQMINFIKLDDDKRLVDLPGYGFAKVPAKLKQKWQYHLGEYLRQRQSLVGLIVLMDIRHPLSEFDLAMLAWNDFGLPIHVLLTKADKLKRGAANNSRLKISKELNKDYPQVSVSMFSSLKNQGVEELAQVLDQWLRS